jgi:hypothetical protein
MLLNQLQEIALRLLTRAYACGGVQATRTHICALKPAGALEQKSTDTKVYGIHRDDFRVHENFVMSDTMRSKSSAVARLIARF